MKRSRFTETKIVKILKEAEAGVAVEKQYENPPISKETEPVDILKKRLATSVISLEEFEKIKDAI